jgi:hypothetical protein
MSNLLRVSVVLCVRPIVATGQSNNSRWQGVAGRHREQALAVFMAITGRRAAGQPVP